MTPPAAKRLMMARVGHAGGAPIQQQRELIFGVGIQAAAQQRRAGLQHGVVGTAAPDIRRLIIQRCRTGRVGSIEGRAAILDHAGFVRTVAPAEQPAFVDRIERVDK